MLKDDGIMALQSETPILLQDVFFETQKKLRSLWKNVHPYFAGVPLYASGSWSWTWCSDRGGHLEPDLERAAPIIEQAKYYNEVIHQSTFGQPNYVRNGLKKL